MRYLKFWGTRGSCPVSGAEYLKFGGNTSSLELRYDDHLLIFDAGTGIRALGTHLKHEKNITLFIGHTHWDHVLGLPFFDPIYRKDVKITIYAPASGSLTPRRKFQTVFSPEFFPVNLKEVQAKMSFKTLKAKEEIKIGPLSLSCHPVNHPGVTYCFKIKTPEQTIGYVSDNEIKKGATTSLIKFHKNTDILIHEAQYSAQEYSHKKGWGHSSIPETVKLVRSIQPKEWLVMHHDPEHTDTDLLTLEKQTRTLQLPCPVQWIPDHHVLKLK